MSTELAAPAATMAPAVRACHVRALTGVLHRLSAWVTRKELAALLGDPTPGFERKVRAVASVAAPVVVSYPGSPGYKHFEAATVDEIRHCIAAFRASGTDQIRRAKLYERALDRRLARERAVETQQTFTLE